MKILTKIFGILIIAVLTSCYSQKINLNQDKKSGNMMLDYSFNDDDFEILSLILSAAPVGGEIGIFDPSVLIDQKAFLEYFNDMNIPELTLKKAIIGRKQIGKTGVYTGSIIIEFSDFESLLSKIPAMENGFSIKKENGKVSLQQTVKMNEMGDMETLDNYIDLIKENKSAWYKQFVTKTFLIEINLESPIVESRGIIVSADKKTAKYTFKTGDMIGANRKDLDFMIKF